MHTPQTTDEDVAGGRDAAAPELRVAIPKLARGARTGDRCPSLQPQKTASRAGQRATDTGLGAMRAAMRAGSQEHGRLIFTRLWREH